MFSKLIVLIIKKEIVLISNLKKKGIEARQHFYPLNRMDPFKSFCKGKYPESNEVALKSICLPSSPFLTKNELKYVTTTFLNEVNKLNS